MMKDKELRKEFDDLVRGFRDAGVITLESIYFHTDNFKMITGRYGTGGIIHRVNMLEKRIEEQNMRIDRILEYFDLEEHEPDCKMVLHKKKPAKA